MTFSKCPTQRRTTNAAENLVQFSAALASVASNPTTALTVRLLFDRGMVFTAATFRASCPLVSDSLLSCFRVTGRVRTTRAPSVRVVVTRVAFCVYNTKCRRKAASWLLRSMTLRSHFGTCPAPAGKCALKHAVRSRNRAKRGPAFRCFPRKPLSRFCPCFRLTISSDNIVSRLLRIV